MNIINLIDMAKAHLSYIPDIKTRDKEYFRILEDIRMYATFGEKFTKLENFQNFWKMRESIDPAKTYKVGAVEKNMLPGEYNLAKRNYYRKD